MNHIHAMIDLETLATTPDAIVTQIGLVLFDEHGPRHDGDHEWIVNVRGQEQRGRLACDDTIRWHLKAGERAEQLARSYSEEAISVGAATGSLFECIHEAAPKYIWAKSPSFDLRILEDIVGGADRIPWKFYQERDVRTAFHLLELAGNKPVLKKSHRAIDDALEQAEWVARTMRLARTAGTADLTVGEPADITHEPEPAT